MSRINSVNNEEANYEQLELLEAIEKDLGMVPNFLRVLANSPTALRAYLGLHGVARDGDLDPSTRERIALAIAQQNACEYCVSAHTDAGLKTDLDEVEMTVNRRGTSQNQRAAVAVQLARSLAEKSGAVTTQELIEVRKAGYSDAEIAEIIVHVGLSFLSNLVANASRVELDFPKIDLELER